MTEDKMEATDQPDEETLDRSILDRPIEDTLEIDLASQVPVKRRKGIYILPNFFTLAALFSGFYAVIAAMNGDFTTASVAIFIAMILDSLDGRVARLINAQSAFGAELDSLSDIVCFGVAPALMIYKLDISYLHNIHWGKVAWLCSFIYMGCVALRLARFNIQTDEAPTAFSKRYFSGLPCPAPAGLLAALVWLVDTYSWASTEVSIFFCVFLVILAALQISSIPFRSFKDIDLNVRVRFAAIVIILVALVLISWQPPEVLSLIFLTYCFSGPVSWLWKNRKLGLEKLKRGRGAK